MKMIYNFSLNYSEILFKLPRSILNKRRNNFNFCTGVVIDTNGLMRVANFNKETQKIFIDHQDIPKPKDNQCLVKVQSFGINRADLLFKAGKYPKTKEMSNNLGLEFAGNVVMSNGVVTRQRVMSIIPSGGYSEYVVVNKDHLIPVPENIEIGIAGGIPEVFLTAYQLLRFVKQSNNLNPNSNILVHGAASGVGTTLVQLIKILYKSNIIGSVSSEDKKKFVEELGADLCVLRNDPKKLNVIMDYLNTKNSKLNAVLDHVGKTEFNNNVKLLGEEGIYVSYGLVSGGDLENVSLAELLNKRLHLVCTTLAARSSKYKAELVKEFKDDVLPLIRNDKVKLVVDSVIDFREESIEEAHKKMKNNQNIGKIIVKF